MVEIYTKTNCPSCIEFKKKLEKEGIKFKERNVENDEDAYIEMINIGKPGMSFPVVNLLGVYYYNFDDKKIIKKINEGEQQ